MRLAWKALLFAALAAFPFVVHFMLLDSLGATALAGLWHAGAFLFMLWLFGRTLRAGREPLISRAARSVHGALDAEMVRFTRNLTVAWCVFFSAQLAGSALLLAFAPLSAWSMFINVLDLPLLALMLVGQYVYRTLRYPQYPRVSIARMVSAFTQVKG